MTAWKHSLPSEPPREEAPPPLAPPPLVSSAPAGAGDAERARAVIRVRLSPRPDFALVSAFVCAVEALPPVASVELADDGEGLVCQMETDDADAAWRALVLLSEPRLTGWRVQVGGGWSAQLSTQPAASSTETPEAAAAPSPPHTEPAPAPPAAPAPAPEAPLPPQPAADQGAPGHGEAGPPAVVATEALPSPEAAPAHAQRGVSLAALVREGQARTRSFEDLLHKVRAQTAMRVPNRMSSITSLLTHARGWRASLTPARLRVLRIVWIVIAVLAVSSLVLTLWAQSRSSGGSHTPGQDTGGAAHSSVAADGATPLRPLQTPDTRNRALPVTPPPTPAATTDQAATNTTVEPAAPATVAATPSPTPTETATPAPPPPTPTPAPAVVRHRVQPGETVFTIAQFYGVSMAAIVAANNLSATGSINAGQELIIPR